MAGFFQNRRLILRIPESAQKTTRTRRALMVSASRAPIHFLADPLCGYPGLVRDFALRRQASWVARRNAERLGKNPERRFCDLARVLRRRILLFASDFALFPVFISPDEDRK